MKKTCPNCNGVIKRKSIGFADGFSGIISMELMTWIIAIILIFNVYSGNSYIINSALVILIVVAYFIEREYATYSCNACGKKYIRSQL